MSFLRKLFDNNIHKPEHIHERVRAETEYETFIDGKKGDATKMTNEELYTKRRELVDKAADMLRAHYDLALVRVETALTVRAEEVEKKSILVEARALVIRDHYNIIIAALKDAGHLETASALGMRLKSLMDEKKS